MLKNELTEESRWISVRYLKYVRTNCKSMFLSVDVGIFSRHFSKKVVVLIENFLSMNDIGFAENVFKKFSLYIMKELDT